MVVDGTGQARYQADIAIDHDKIAKIGKINTKAHEYINAENLIVAPGFIDIHSHSELSTLVNPAASSKVYQGITTEVTGNCGSSLAPLDGPMVAKVKERLVDYRLPLSWRNTREYFEILRQNKSATNLVTLIGHGLLRQTVVGYRNREATDIELERMKAMLAQALEEGAYGLSTGLIYPPSSYASTEELVSLAKVVAKYDGIYTTHLRSEGDRLVAAVKEAIIIAQQSNVKVQISHHKAIGQQNWGKVNQTLELINQARERGLDITCDFYPYLATSTGLSALLPDWIFGGQKEEVINRLKDNYQQIIDYLNQERSRQDGWEQIIVAEAKNHKDYEGLTIKEIAQQLNQKPAEVAVELLIAENLSTSMIKFSISEADLRKVLQVDFSMVGTDAISRVKGTILANSHCHPRTYGSFPRVIDRYVKSNLISLEKAIKKMTYLPAKKLGLQRGLIEPGYFADLVIFDLEKIKDCATYSNPHRYAVGVEFLIVNGNLVIKDGKQLSNLSGYVLTNN
ncbi:N-acyl-D-amino-acid deacylase family protein [Natroniella sp. ANB-PHB2]|uniref:N-acyl-D-amino-acid deacylase family protein n=1 Tax=Natroniella sp. ANB-PHB2 TaxID=3384444 RepID=UPI0038D376FF